MIEDYRIYQFSRKEFLFCLLEGMLLNGVISILFYNSFLAMLPGMLLMYFYFKEKQRILMQKRMKSIRMEFKEFLSGLIAALQTGRSIENAFMEALKDTRQFLGKDTVFLLEMKKISSGISIGKSMEVLLLDFSSRSHLEEIEYFAEVFSIGKRSGGNIVGMMKNTIGMIQERMDAEEEIYTILAEKQMEFYIMCVIPLGMMIYLRIGAGTMVNALYGNLTGITVMTFCLGVYGGCFLYGKRLLEMEDYG